MAGWMKAVSISLSLSLCFALTACGSISDHASSGESVQQISETKQTTAGENGEREAADTSESAVLPEEKEDAMTVTINGKEYAIELENNQTAEAFAEMFPLTLEMDELNGNEKMQYLDTTLPSASENIGEIKTGDIMLFGSSCVVIFYKSFHTSYSYTRIGRIENPEDLSETVGRGSITAEFNGTKPEGGDNQVRYARDNAVAQTENKEIATRVLENGTKVNIYFGDVLVPGTLNDSKAAKALIDMLPYTVKVNRYDFDVCGMMKDSLPYNPEDVHNGWLNGDIDFATDGNWFTILFDNEEGSDSYGYQVNLGKVDCELSVLEGLSGAYEVRIELAE